MTDIFCFSFHRDAEAEFNLQMRHRLISLGTIILPLYHNIKYSVGKMWFYTKSSVEKV